MQKNEFALFKKFVNKEQAIELIELLKEHDIPFETQDNSSFFDATFANNSIDNEIEIKILQSDFNKTNELLELEYDKVVNQFEGEHYLYDFTNEELVEVLVKPDEWNAFDFKLAQKILKERNGNVNDEFINKLKENRILVLSKKETPDLT